MPHPVDDDLALLALGEPVPQAERHVRDCGTCSAELLALRSTVETARAADRSPTAPPPPQVWQRISDELGLDDGPVHRSVVRSMPWRRPLAAAAVLAAAAAAAGVLVAVVTEPASPPSVPLVALGQVQASGEVVLSDLAAGRSLLVDTAGLPDTDGSYEVWLLDPDEGRLVTLGVLDDGGRGRLTVPEGVRVADYPTVDVSLEPDDGDPGHSGDSVLRADLPAELP